ncbi:TD and POZ domain-containing protein 2-like [Nasonia vitripennis]|uniref:MATH domain-containing protein n=1 Tax=Nasonia vitripennis TaxID=7425 RepID=A0A7M7Q101_NASVI|nr:TD and POZ domain-containing protein 2-like [Nasonia vitripennis]
MSFRMDLNMQRRRQRDVTHIRVKEFEYTCLIENFKFYHCQVRKELQSPVFRMGDNDEYKWCLHLYPNGYADQDEDYLSVYLELLEETIDERAAFLVLYLVKRNGDDSDVAIETFIEKIKHGNSQKREFPKFTERAYVFDKSNDLLPNGALTLRCKLYLTDEIVNVSHPSETFLPADQMLS